MYTLSSALQTGSDISLRIKPSYKTILALNEASPKPVLPQLCGSPIIKSTQDTRLKVFTPEKLKDAKLLRSKAIEVMIKMRVINSFNAYVHPSSTPSAPPPSRQGKTTLLFITLSCD